MATEPSLFADPSHRTSLFRQRYNLIHQRLLRNESFQTASIAPSRAQSLHGNSLHRTMSNITQQQAYKLTPIANLLGRSGSNHVLLGLITTSTTGNLVASDLTGSILLDISHARPMPENGAWFTPGMIVIFDGIYEEEGTVDGAGLGGGGGVGGTIGGKFVALSVGGPPCERRDVTLGMGGSQGEHDSSAGGFGWVDFLGVGSERSIGSRMRALEKKIIGRGPSAAGVAGRSRIVVLGEVNLDNPRTLQALRKILGHYASEIDSEMPMAFVLVGNFVTHPVMAGGGSGGSIEYKEYFDALASLLSEFPNVLQAAAFVFVPGDNDPWASAFSAGAATVLPRKPIPDLFTSRIKRAFAAANAEAADKSPDADVDGEAVWTTNPARLSLFGPAQEIAIFRDDMSGRLRRSAIRFRAAEQAQEKAEDEDEDKGGEPSNSLPPAADDEMQLGSESDGLEHTHVDAAIAAASSHAPAAEKAGPLASGTARDRDGSESDVLAARKLIKTLLDQGHLSPFPLAHRPVLWDYGAALQLYPLPSALVLVDAEAPPFAATYEGCHVMNPGPACGEGRWRGRGRRAEEGSGELGGV